MGLYNIATFWLESVKLLFVVEPFEILYNLSLKLHKLLMECFWQLQFFPQVGFVTIRRNVKLRGTIPLPNAVRVT